MPANLTTIYAASWILDIDDAGVATYGSAACPSRRSAMYTAQCHAHSSGVSEWIGVKELRWSSDQRSYECVREWTGDHTGIEEVTP